jgi:predicted metal-dependent phosphoesterase TrpH
MHTNRSDGQLQPQKLVEQAVEIGLRGFAITDHHSIEGYRVAHKALQAMEQSLEAPSLKESLPQLWPGVEITAELSGTQVHILGFAFDPSHPPLEPYLQGKAPTGPACQAQAVIQTIQMAGGLAVLAHPARYRRSIVELITAAAELGIDGVETYYAYGNPFPWQPSPRETNTVHRLAQAYELLSTCGTDTHGQNLLKRV